MDLDDGPVKSAVPFLLSKSMAIDLLNELDGKDLEFDHMFADEVLLSFIRWNGGGQDVVTAYGLAKSRCKFRHA